MQEARGVTVSSGVSADVGAGTTPAANASCTEAATTKFEPAPASAPAPAVAEAEAEAVVAAAAMDPAEIEAKVAQLKERAATMFKGGYD